MERLKKGHQWSLKTEKNVLAYFFLVEKMNYVFFLFLEIGNSFFWCCNTCCISCSIRHQSVHFFRKMSIVSHLMTFSVKYRVIHMEKWPIFKIFLIKSNCCLPFHLWILFTNVSTYYKTSKNLKCQSESNTFAKKFFLSQFWSIYFSAF